MATVIGVFTRMESAEQAVESLRAKGFEENSISIVARDEERSTSREMEMGEDTGVGENIADGTAWGGAIGGVAGLLAGVGALAIPGIGPIIAAGPLAGALSGAVTGGVAGGLIDMGIPEERGRAYEGQLRKGGILAVVETSNDKVEDAAQILRRHDAQDVESHAK